MSVVVILLKIVQVSVMEMLNLMTVEYAMEMAQAVIHRVVQMIQHVTMILKQQLMMVAVIMILIPII